MRAVQVCGFEKNRPEPSQRLAWSNISLQLLSLDCVLVFVCRIVVCVRAVHADGDGEVGVGSGGVRLGVVEDPGVAASNLMWITVW